MASLNLNITHIGGEGGSVSSLKKTEPLPWILTFTDLLQQALALVSSDFCRRGGASAACTSSSQQPRGAMHTYTLAL
jgi:hypothetical protein